MKRAQSAAQIARLMRAPSLAQKRIRRRVITAKKTKFHMSGGPLVFAWLTTPGTLNFRVGQWSGRYDNKNNWVPK